MDAGAISVEMAIPRARPPRGSGCQSQDHQVSARLLIHRVRTRRCA